MLSIARLHRVEYYLAGQDGEGYFAKGSEARGQWFGLGAQRLGLRGTVKANIFKLVFRGFGLDGNALVTNAGGKKRCPGWDLTFSAPKWVSVLVGLSLLPVVRATIITCHRKAVAATLRLLEREAAYARAGKGGWRFLRAELAIAIYEHYASRAGDMDLHSHCLVANVGVCEDGVTRALYSRQFYRWKLALGAYYRNELAFQLQSSLGLAIKPEGHAFAIDGLPNWLIRHFSKRSQAIEDELLRRGHSSARVAEKVALSTRQRKHLEALAESLQRWQTEAERLGFACDQTSGVLHRAACPLLPFEQLRAAIETGIAKLTESQAHFTFREVLRQVAPALITRGASSPEIAVAVQGYLQRSPEIIHLQEINLERQYSTRDMIEREAALLTHCDALHRRGEFGVAESYLDVCLQKHPGVAERAEQAAALKHLLAESALTLLSGMPGTGKTYVLKAAREAWERAGFRVVGAALAGKAARELENKAEIESDTIARWLKNLESTPLDDAKHHANQPMHGAQGQRTFAADRLSLDRSTVLVVDEAGMIDTVTAERLLRYVETAGAKLVLVGDPRQLPPIGAGGPFTALLSRHPHVELTDIRRQTDARDIAAIHALSRGDVRQALASYEERGLLHLADDRRQAIDRLVQDWAAHGGIEKPDKHAILVCTNAERLQLNQLCQKQRFHAGQLNTELYVTLRTLQEVEGAGTMVLREDLHVGDRVMCLERYRPLELENGQTGRVTWIDREAQTIGLRIEVDGQQGRDVAVPLQKYAQLTLCYAATTHKLQGATVDNSYVLLGGSLQSREITLVQISRASGTTRLYADALEAGKDLSGLVQQIEQSRPKLLAHDLLPDARPEREVPPPPRVRPIDQHLKKVAEELAPVWKQKRTPPQLPEFVRR